MRQLKITICTVLLLGNICIGACASNGRQEVSPTAKETVDCVMESLRAVDLGQFNACTDNYVETHRNWIGIPVGKEYRVFNELLQPGIKTGKWKKKYELNRELAGKMMENLVWEIEDVEEKQGRAEITMEITNLNMGEIIGKYEICIWENMIESTVTGPLQMLEDLSQIADGQEGLLALIESCDEEDVYTSHVTVTAYQEDGAWRLHLDEEFINAFMGNINADEYSEDTKRRIAQLEEQYGEKLDEWEEEFGKKYFK